MWTSIANRLNWSNNHATESTSPRSRKAKRSASSRRSSRSRVRRSGLEQLESRCLLSVAPVLAPIGNQEVPELTALVFTATATDEDVPAQTLTFSLQNEPFGSAIDPATGVFNWTPSELDGPGDYTFTVVVTDNEEPAQTDEEMITVSVSEVNQAPVLDPIGNQSTDPFMELVFTASAIDDDVPANSSMTFDLIGEPTGATINPSTGAFSWTPDASQGPGNYTFKVTITDDGTPQLSDEEQITVTVNSTNTAPVLAAIGAKTVNELSELTFTATATDADDPPQNLTFSLVGQPAGATISETTGAFSWTPTEAQGGQSFTFTVMVADDGIPDMADEEEITVTVAEVNSAPVLSGVPATDTATELLAYTFDAAAMDADLPAQTLTFALVDAPAGATINPTTGVFSWTPSEAQGPQSHTFTVQVSDGVVTTEQEVTLNVNEVNVAPVLSGVPTSDTIPEMAPYTFDADATDVDLPAQTLTFALADAPTGATIDPATGVFSWTPTEAQGPQSYTFKVQVTDGTATTEQSVTLDVTEVNIAPVLASIGNKTVTELSELTLTASATDADVPVNSLTFSLVDPPTGATIDPATGVFSWTPTEAQGPNTYTFTVKVSDNGTPSASDEEQITVIVSEANAAPVLAPIGNKTVAELAPLTFMASATDADGDTLTYSLVSAPTGATINASTGEFTWTPTEAQGPDTYTFTVKVTDDGTPVQSDEEEITVTVTEVNAPPVLAVIGSKSVTQLSTLTFTATATDPDVPANSLSFSLVGAPTGATINSTTGEFSWTPTTAQGPDTFTFTVKVTDNGTPAQSDEEQVSVTVTAEAAPVLAAIGNKTVAELAPLTFTASATDADGDTLTYSLVNAPTGATINASTGEFTWTPTEAQGPDTHTFTVRVADDGTPAQSDEEVITVTVTEVNAPPVLTEIGSKSVTQLSTLTFTAAATDPDVPANSLSFSLVGAPTGATINSTTGEFSWTPTTAQGPDTFTFTVRVTDNGTPAQSDEEQVSVTVTAEAAPVLAAIGNKTVAELATLTFTASATDADGDTLTYSLVNAPTGATINASTGAFSWTPTEAQGPDTHTFTVRVADDGTPAQSDEEVITVTVTEVNAPPVLTEIGSKSVTQLSTLTFTAAATDPDVPANSLSFSLVGAPTGATINATTGEFNWAPTTAQAPGTVTFTIKVTDNGTPAQSDEEQVSVTVTAEAAPVLALIGNKTVAELATLTFTASATDADGDTLTYSLVSAPTGATINASTGAFSWTPTEAQGPGTFTFTVKVTDDGTPTQSDEEQITVTVTEVNSAPVLAAIGNKTVAELATLTFTASATDPDSPANTLTYSLVSAPTGATINSSTGAFSWTPTEAQGPGTFTFTVRATDNGTTPLSDEEQITVTVTEVGSAPVLASIGNKTAAELALLTFTASATDADGDTLTYSLVNAPTGATINATTGAFSWTPTEAQGPGTFTFTVKATDNGTTPQSDEESITVTVTEVNSPPVLAAIGNKTVAELSALTFTASATDPDLPANALTYSLVSGPTGATINSSTGAFSWTPTEAQGPGTFTFTVKATDNGTSPLSDEEQITVTVTEANNAPVNQVPGRQSTAVNAALVFSAANSNAISVSDPDAGAAAIQVRLAAASGTLTLSGTTGLTFTEGDGTDDAALTFTGTIANINTALNGLSFKPTTDFNGTASVTITTNDQGNTGGSALTDEDRVDIDVGRLARVSGFVYADTNDNGQPDENEGVPGVKISLSATGVARDTWTDDNGRYEFLDLAAGTYAITEEQPGAFIDDGDNTITNLQVDAGEVVTGQDFVEQGLQPIVVGLRFLAASSQPVGSTTWQQMVRQSISRAMAQSGNSTPPVVTQEIVQNGSQVTVRGTNNADTFRFTPGTTQHTVQINDEVQQFDAAVVKSLRFDGGLGKDSAVLVGSSSGNDEAELAPMSAILNGTGYSVEVASTENIEVQGNGQTADETATLVDSASDDLLEAAGNIARMSSFYYDNMVSGFEKVTANSEEGGTDRKRLNTIDFVLEEDGWVED